MTKLPQGAIDALNKLGSLNGPDAAPQTLLATWIQEWVGPCVDPMCQRPHHFSVTLSLGQPHETEWPQAKLVVEKDFQISHIRLTKARLAELIEDAQQLLDALP